MLLSFGENVVRHAVLVMVILAVFLNKKFFSVITILHVYYREKQND